MVKKKHLVENIDEEDGSLFAETHSEDDIALNTFLSSHESEEGEEGEGSSGQAGAIQFHDFITPAGERRDDLLPHDEKKRLLSVHKEFHEIRVKKQKELRDQRQALKEGKLSLDAYRAGLGAGKGEMSPYKPNPVLADKVQFSGIDMKESPLPTINDSDANPDQRDELEHQYRLTHTPEYQARPRFNPKPTIR